MPAWRPFAGLIRSLSALWGVTHHSPAASGFTLQTGTGVVPQPGLEVVAGCLQISWTYVIGVDPHRDAARARGRARSSVARSCVETDVAADSGGYAEALKLVDVHAPGRRAFAVEGTGSLRRRTEPLPERVGERVLEVGRFVGSAARAARPTRWTRSGRRAACSAQRAAGHAAGWRVNARRCGRWWRPARARSAPSGPGSTSCEACWSPPPNRCASELRASSPKLRLLRRLAATRPGGRRDPSCAGAARAALGRSPCAAVDAEERELAREIDTLIRKLAPQLLDQPGVGTRTAAQLVLAWSHPRPLPHRKPPSRGSPASHRSPPPPATTDPLPPRPIRRPQTQPRPPHDHSSHESAYTQPTTAYIEPPNARRQDPPRSKPLPQALPRTQPLPPTRAPTADAT